MIKDQVIKEAREYMEQVREYNLNKLSLEGKEELNVILENTYDQAMHENIPEEDVVSFVVDFSAGYFGFGDGSTYDEAVSGDPDKEWMADKYKKVEAGVWSVPFTTKQAYKLAELVEKIPGEGLKMDDLYDLVGEDMLWDEISNHLDEIKALIVARAKEMVKDYKKEPELFRGKFEDEAIEVIEEL